MQIKTLKNGKPTKARLLAVAIALSFCGSWACSPAQAAEIVVPEGTSVDGQIINDRHWQNVKGIANNTTLNDSSSQEVYGTANHTVLNDKSFQRIAAGGTVNHTTLHDRVIQQIEEGGSANSTILNDSSCQYVYGIANSTLLNGDSYQWIEAGGIANNTTLNGTSTQYIFDTANYTTLNDSSWQLIVEGGTAKSSTLNDAASQYVYGAANNTILNGSSIQYLYGVANNTLLNGASFQRVEAGGRANNVTLNENSRQYVYGTANHAALYDGSWQLIGEGGTAKSSTLNDAASQYVYGAADNTILNDSSYQGIYGNGVVNDSVLNNTANQWVRDNGTANDTVLYGASGQYIASGGNSYRTGVNDHAVMVVDSGAAAYDTTVNKGTIYVKRNAILKNDNDAFGAAVKINSGGTLAVVEDGAAVDGNVAMRGGAIAFLRQNADAGGLIMSAGDGYKTFTINGDLSGGGQVAMSTNINDGASDRLIINGNVTGAYQVGFANGATAAADGSETVRDVIQSGGGTGGFSGEAEYGGYIYELKQNESGYWDLVGTGKASSSSSASFSTFSAGHLLNYAETTTLHQRLGDLRRGEVPDAPWVRVYGGRFSVGAGRTVSGYGMSYRGVQIGLDRMQETNGGKVYTGGMLGYTSAGQSYNSGSGSADSATLGLYRTYAAPDGRYADLVVKYGWMSSDYKVLDTASAWAEGNLSTRGPSLSLEAGQRLYQDKANNQGWYLEPQAQFDLGRRSGGRFTASNGLAVKVDNSRSVLGRLGVVVGREIRHDSRPMNAYGKISYVKEFDGDIGFTMNGSPAQESLGGSWWSYGVGVAAQLRNDNNLYLDITRANGGKFNQCWQLNLGLRGQFR